ncbi:hypothetical protein BKA66DRAFT_409043 [Pyrenochaeta sp. MPI-SDFR-AT-0127]|nr:hypothetical protein BKA66DRAFT_409043 [Pyrenochaeta sp. MPI-SDFR-AT-0127]
MAFVSLLISLLLVPWTNLAAALTPIASSMQIRNAPGTSVNDTYLAIRQGLAAASLNRREEFKAEIPLERSWMGATLLSIQLAQEIPQSNQNRSLEVRAGIEITCTTCYVRGLATAELTISDGFNASQAINAERDSIRQNVKNFTDTFENYLDTYRAQVMRELSDGFDMSDFEFPTFPFAFDLDVPEIPECALRFQFDDMELYMEVNTVLSAGATYEINLYSSNSPAGISIGPMLQLGFVLQVDLILSVEGAVDISSGFHIKLDDGIAMDITLFGDKVSNMIFNGGQFEFLPVTVESAGIAISAVLRIGVHCGIEVGTPDTFDTVKVSSGIEVAVFAHVAEFITNVTYDAEDKACPLKVIQEYNLAVGGIAGASVVVDVPILEPKTWGPVIEKSIAVFTATLAEVCAIQGTPSPVPASVTAFNERRKELTITTISTVITTSGVSCAITGLANCPVSAQVTTRTKSTKTLVTAVPSGVEAKFPETTFNSVPSTIRFGTRAQTIKATSGSPVAYTAPPPPPPPPTSTDGNHIEENGKAVKKSVIIGVSVGLGVPILLSIIGGLL